MTLSIKQREFYDAFKTQKYKFMLYGGAVGGGKSILQIGILHQLSLDYPGTRWAIVRKNLKTLKRTSIPSYKKVLALNDDEYEVKINYSEYIAEYKNGSQMIFVEADITKDREFDKLKGLEISGALIEEANEVDEQAFTVLKTRVGRWMNVEYSIRPFIMLNCNPAKNWVKTDFYNPWVSGKLPDTHYYLPALPSDNPHNSQDYLALLETLPETERQRYVLGNWEYSDDPNQLLSYLAIKDVIFKGTFEGVMTKLGPETAFMGVDVARYGDDKSVIALGVGNVIAKIERYSKISTTELARIIQEKQKLYKIKPERIHIDAVGVGGGVVDTLRDYGLNVTSFGGGDAASSTGPSRFMSYKNKRAQAHWELRDDIINQRIEIVEDKEFIMEATNINYKIDERVIQIESKESFKKRLGRSPDVLDAIKIANYARNFKRKDFFIG